MIAVVFIFVLHKWKKNTLLSIAGGNDFIHDPGTEFFQIMVFDITEAPLGGASVMSNEFCERRRKAGNCGNRAATFRYTDETYVKNIAAYQTPMTRRFH